MLNQILEIKEKLNSWFIDRDSEILGLLLAALSGNHVFLLGPPGTGKTRLIRLFTDLIGGSTFKIQLGKFTEPRQLFGRLSIAALEQDKERYLDTNKIQTSDMAFIDEIWKASNAIVNDLLTILEDKVFIEDGIEKNIPLISCASASNELPAEGEGLEAIYDRFMLRFYTGDLSSSDFNKMLINPPPSKTSPVMTIEEFRKDSEKIDTVMVPENIINTLVKLREELKKDGIEVSLRRWAKSLRILKAMAWMDASNTVTDDHLIVLSHILWRKPDEVDKVTDIIIRVANPTALKVRQILDLAKEMVDTAPMPKSGASSKVKSEILQQLFGVQSELNSSVEQLNAIITDSNKSIVNANMKKLEELKKVIDDRMSAIVSGRNL